MKNQGIAHHFDRRCKCDWCGQVEICAVTQYGTTHYNRLVCLECALSINENDRPYRPYPYFDLNNSTIRFGENLVYDCTKENDNEDQ